VTADGLGWVKTARGGVLREVEVKYRIQDLDALIAALRIRSIALSEPFCQDDQAYAPDGWTYGDDRSGVPFAHLRTVQGRHVFTLKRPAENVLSCEEHETAVADRDQMHRAIIAMGFRPTVRIIKTRPQSKISEAVRSWERMGAARSRQAMSDSATESSSPPVSCANDPSQRLR
jgi:hypothetical protein